MLREFFVELARDERAAATREASAPGGSAEQPDDAFLNFAQSLTHKCSLGGYT